MINPPPLPAPSAETGRRVVKVVALIVIALVVLCGLVGSCFFLFTLVSPLIFGTPTVAPPL